MKQYQQYLERLYKLTLHKKKWDLLPIKTVYEAIYSPAKNFPSIHIAGSNGKGSCAYKIYNALLFSGYKVGLFSSPHLFSFRERIVINQKKISPQHIVEGLQVLFSLSKRLSIELSFFEMVTLLALWYFAKQKVDIAIIETGIGGRLDATNILTPILSIITSISFDHTDRLGKTLEEIAFEKAGIIKQNTPVILGPNAKVANIEKIAKEKNASLTEVISSSAFFDEENAAIAKAAIFELSKTFSISSSHTERAIKKRPKCRFEVFTKEDLLAKNFKNAPKALILDVAHNVDAIEKLKKALQKYFPNSSAYVIVGFSQKKEITLCLKKIASFASHIYSIEASYGQTIKKEELFFMGKQQEIKKISCLQNIKVTLEVAFKKAYQTDGVVLVCGSFYIMDDIKKNLFFLKKLNHIKVSDIYQVNAQ